MTTEETLLISDLVMLLRRQSVRLLQGNERDIKLAKECMDFLRRKELASGADILRIIPTINDMGSLATYIMRHFDDIVDDDQTRLNRANAAIVDWVAHLNRNKETAL